MWQIIIKWDSYFITKCYSLLQNTSGFLLQNATALLQNTQLLQNATILLQNTTFITNCDSTIFQAHLVAEDFSEISFLLQ